MLRRLGGCSGDSGARIPYTRLSLRSFQLQSIEKHKGLERREYRAQDGEVEAL